MKTIPGSLRVAVSEDLGEKKLTERLLLGSDGKSYGRMVDGHHLIEARDS